MMNDNLSRVDAAIAIKVEILDTYEGMASLWDGESEYAPWAHVFDRIDSIRAEIAALEAEWNRILVAAEAA
jgi:hypothetical protein